MRCCRTQRKGTCTTREENRRSKREAWVEDLLRWTSSTCSLEGEGGCREREKVGHAFGGARGGSYAGQRAFSNGRCVSGVAVGKNVVHQLSVSLEEMYKGSTRRLGLQKNVICEKCEGILVLVSSSSLKSCLGFIKLQFLAFFFFF